MSELVAVIDTFLEATRAHVRAARLSPIEKRTASALGKVFRQQGQIFISGFANLAPKFPGIIDETEWMRYLDIALLSTRDAFLAAIEPGMKEAMRRGIKRGLGEVQESALREALGDEDEVGALFGIRFGLENPRAVQFLRTRGAALVSRVDETTRDYIRTVVIDGARQGWSYDQMARQLTARYREFAVGRPQQHIDSRAHLIAVTEVGEAYSEGNLNVARGLADAGLVMEKSWDTMGDDRVSEGCLQNAAAGWIPLDDTFPSGHLRPLRFPGCRCDLLMRRVGAGGS
jgi:hypothetical protein